MMSLVLCTGANVSVLETRRFLLEKGGHSVVTASNEQEISAACEQHKFDVAVIGDRTEDKVRFAGMIRKHCPSVKIVEMYHPEIGQILDDADSWLQVPVVPPSDLAKRVTELANRG